MSIIIEICADSCKSVENASKSNAKRIELCSALEIGGITPSIGFVQKALEISAIPINVLIRPRAGNFVYSDEEFEIMCDDIIELKEAGINGIVSGVLTNDGQIDIERNKKLVELTHPLEFTFHRAFDNCPNQKEAIVNVIRTGADRLLTSGGFANVDAGKEVIFDIHRNYGEAIIIMPGGGINLENAEMFLSNGIKEIHLSAGKFEKDTAYLNPELEGMGHHSLGNENGYKYSDVDLIKSIVELS